MFQAYHLQTRIPCHISRKSNDDGNEQTLSHSIRNDYDHRQNQDVLTNQVL